MTRRARAFVGTALIAFALATPLGGRAVGRACAAGNVHVAIVVDSGSGSSVSAVCVPVGDRDNGATLLAARARMLGTPQPSFDGRSGLLCAIDGFPQGGCGERHGGRYAYWAYFHGVGGQWQYSNIGPGGTRVNPSIVEGWRFQPDGAGLPTDPPPRGPATAGAICKPQTTPTTARPSGSGTTTPPAAVTTPGVTPTTAAVIGSQSPGTVGASGVTTTTSASTTKTTTKGSTATTARGHSSTTIATGSGTATTSSSIELTAGGIAAGPDEQSSGGIPVGAIVGVVLVIGLGAGGAVAALRRRRPAS